MGLTVDDLVSTADRLVGGASDPATAPGLVVRLLAAERPGWDWTGIYLLAGDALVLGPYAGEPTEHVRIPVGVGVCGTAVAEHRTVVVDDVAALDNYLACSVGTRSEIVVLIEDGGEVVAQFDVDSDTPARFGAEDEALLTRLAPLVAPGCRVLRDRLAETEPAGGATPTMTA